MPDAHKEGAKEAPARSPRGNIEALAAALVDDIRNGNLVPGQRLLEAELAEHHKVGRGTVREVIRRLSGEGLLKVDRFRGASVRLLSDKEILDILAVLELLFGLAARQAAARIDEGDNRDRLERVVTDLLELEGSDQFYAAVRRREEYINTIIEIGGNSELDRVMPKLQLLIARVQLPNLVPDKQRYADYRLLGEAILAGEEGLAEYVARMHMQHSITAFKARL